MDSSGTWKTVLLFIALLAYLDLQANAAPALDDAEYNILVPQNVEAVDYGRNFEIHHGNLHLDRGLSRTGDDELSWPCPDRTAISPCTCISDVVYNLDMDCSLINSDQQIIDSFKVVFPFDDISHFVIENNDNIATLSAYMFDKKSFQFVSISHTSMKEIEDNVFSYSHATLTSIIFEHNEITLFPFDVIKQYTTLNHLKLNDNHLATLPRFSSTSLLSLIMNSNPGLTLVDEEKTFVDIPNLRTIKLANIGLTKVVPHLFSTLQDLREIYISGNNIATLEQFSIDTPLSTIKILYLADNSISTVNVGAITGLQGDAELNLVGNQITEMTKDVWRPILKQMVVSGNLKLDDNPLRCGCDMYWIVQDQQVWDLFSVGSTCHAGGNVRELDIAVFDHMCAGIV